MTVSHALPPHPREDLHRFVNDLNVRYNIGVPIPDPTLTPARRRECETPAARIYRRLEAHFFTGGLSSLTAILRDFDHEAKAFWSKWVKKPQGDPDTLPHTAQPPLAANLAERDWLQKEFNRVLDKTQPNMPAPRTFGRTRSGPAAFGGPSNQPSTYGDGSRPSQPKRHADAEAKASKRQKADPDPIRDLTASASCRRRADASAAGTSVPSGVRVATPRGSAGRRPELAKSFVSASTNVSTSTSRSFPSEVFSVSGDPVPTQDTVGASTQPASSQEQDRPTVPCSQSSYVDSPTSTMEDALVEASFQETVGSFPQPRGQDPSPTAQFSSDVKSRPRGGADSSLLAPVSKNSNAAIEDGSVSAMRVRLQGIWPAFPSWLRTAPFAIAWEVTRIAQACGVDLAAIEDLRYDEDWKGQKALRKALWQHKEFQGKPFPEATSDSAWAAAGLGDQAYALPFDQQVVYSASLDFSKSDPKLLSLRMHPLKLDQSYRLARRYGADRFLELLLPSPDTSNLPAFIKDHGSFFEAMVQWLVGSHAFCGREWKAFYTKSGGSRKPQRDIQFGPDPKPVYKDRIYLFAEDSRTPLRKMLLWALHLRHSKNRSQPVLKLFQRIALVLSRTSPTVVFKPSLMRHHDTDIISPAGKVMNDGIAKMSPAVARKIREYLGLSATPRAVQARLGSAKGMWIIDTTVPSSSEDVWIETYPSQRKWEMDWSAADVYDRTLEIHNIASLPRPAGFNLQFLPVIEDRATSKEAMRRAIGDLLKLNLRKELDGQKKALQSPPQFRQWCHENSAHRHDRVIHGHVPYQGGSPEEDEEVMNTMLDAGFDSRSNKFLAEIAYNMQKRKCETLARKLNITVGRSAYLYMVVDFEGILEEDEVHIGFSTAFVADDDWAKTMVQGPVLVARSPAHFVSDIQKVQAVFKPQLADLTDVVVFSSKGNIPLADKLSGGDYDGDLAWVCWDSRIVDNFENAAVPEQPDLSEWISKDEESFHGIYRRRQAQYDKPLESAVADMMKKCFEFNLSKSMLGACTIYKERLCYETNTVQDDAAVVLSTLLSNLVDQAKQGIKFTADDFRRLREDRLPRLNLSEPMYKKDVIPSGLPVTHIIDHLKFEVAKPTIETELKLFHAALKLDKKAGTDRPQQWDSDLACYYKDFESQSRRSKSVRTLVAPLKVNIAEVAREWDVQMQARDDTSGYPERVARVYKLWQDILPREETLGSGQRSKTADMLCLGGEMSPWALLKASTAFYMYCNPSGSNWGMKPRFVWQMACRQLCYMKSQAVSRSVSGAVGAPAVVIPEMYASLRPDAKYVKQRAVRMGGGSQFGLIEDEANATDEDD